MNEFPIKKIVSGNIRYLRKKLGWSQELLAEKTGVSAPYITQIEIGKRCPSLDIVEKLSTAFGVEYKTLFEINIHRKGSELQKISKQVLEAKLISAITATIHSEFES